MNVSRKNPLIIAVCRSDALGWRWSLTRNGRVLAVSPHGYTTKRKCKMELERIVADLKTDCIAWEVEMSKKANTLLSQIAGLRRKQP
jgi:hypothetical protein